MEMVKQEHQNFILMALSIFGTIAIALLQATISNGDISKLASHKNFSLCLISADHCVQWMISKDKWARHHTPTIDRLIGQSDPFPLYGKFNCVAFKIYYASLTFRVGSLSFASLSMLLLID
jgi:hypothetical protein